jgi:hypothetical protein
MTPTRSLDGSHPASQPGQPDDRWMVTTPTPTPIGARSKFRRAVRATTISPSIPPSRFRTALRAERRAHGLLHPGGIVTDSTRPSMMKSADVWPLTLRWPRVEAGASSMIVPARGKVQGDADVLR